ncbi:MAG TPA: hypothetical protein VKY22_25740 [Bradyrhizobium sp.]|jgi:hypothetical protein|nr:hypothetical protein [Bradyrhizobium sp.]
MTARDPNWSSKVSAMTCVLLLIACAPSSALARGSGLHDAPWNPEHIDRLPPEVRDAVLRMCRVKPDAAHYFATYLDHAKIIRLHFESFNCEGRQIYRDAGLCLHEEFTLSGAHYRQTRSYYDRCND